MKRFIFLIGLVFFMSGSILAHNAFTLVSSVKKTFKESELTELQKQQTTGKRSKSTLEFTGSDIRLVVITGPEDDMLSYRIQGIRNPNLVVPSGAMLTVLFINVDDDMRHDIRFGHVPGEFVAVPEITGTAGTTRLTAKAEDGTVQAEEIILKPNEDGAYKYFCSVRSHATGGMWGNIFVGVKPGDKVTMAPKTKHVHTADEDKETPKKTDDMKDMDMNKPDDMKDRDMNKPGAMKDMKMGNKSDNMSGMSGMSNMNGMRMSSTVNIGESMMREGSGTAWLPESSPMYAKMKMFSDGSMLMFHGVAFLRYTTIGSDRDVSIAGRGSRSRFDAPSMFMLMYSKPLGKKSHLGLRSLFSLDSLLGRGLRYPLLN